MTTLTIPGSSASTLYKHVCFVCFLVGEHHLHYQVGSSPSAESLSVSNFGVSLVDYSDSDYKASLIVIF